MENPTLNIKVNYIGPWVAKPDRYSMTYRKGRKTIGRINNARHYNLVRYLTKYGISKSRIHFSQRGRGHQIIIFF
jgi:hypothetical protein